MSTSAEEPGGLADSVRRRLESGAQVEEVIQELIARGLSRPTAERFVDRAFAEAPSSSAVTEPTPSSPSLNDVGVPFRWTRILARAAIPGAVAAAIGIYIGWGAVQRHNDAKAVAAAELAAADRSRAEQIRSESALQRTIATHERADRRQQRINGELARLDSKQPMTQCEAALALGRLGASEAREPLAALLAFSTSSSVRVCAAGALVDLGERDAPLAVYAEWATSMDDTLRRSAITGFGDIGAPAADIALPHLTQALKSPHWDLRFLVVRSLAKLGPAAGPLLRVASEDSNEHVRDAARAALNAIAAGR